MEVDRGVESQMAGDELIGEGRDSFGQVPQILSLAISAMHDQRTGIFLSVCCHCQSFEVIEYCKSCLPEQYQHQSEKLVKTEWIFAEIFDRSSLHHDA